MTSGQEYARAVQRLRQSQRTWRFARWLFLIIGLALIGTSIWADRQAGRFLLEFVAGSGSLSRLDGLYLSGLIESQAHSFAALCVGIATIVYSLARWKGDPKITVLLQLLDGVSASDETASSTAVE